MPVQGLRTFMAVWGSGGLTYPAISIDHLTARLGRETSRRGTDYARSGRVMRCLWNPKPGNLVGSVRGNRGRTCTTVVNLVCDSADRWTLRGGRCSCPMQVDCKHVAALVVAAAGDTPAPPPSAVWRQYAH